MLKITKNRTCFLLALSVITISCNNLSPKSRYAGYEKVIDESKIISLNETSKQPIVKIDIPTDTSSFDYHKMLYDVRYVPLQTTKASSFGEFNDIYFGSNRIIVVDSKFTESVYIFDNTGVFIKKISTNKNLQDTKDSDLIHFFSSAYLYDKDQIILHDDKGCKNYYYDKDGNFLKVEKAYIAFSSFVNQKGTDGFMYVSLYSKNQHIPILSKTDIYLGKSNTSITHVAPKANQTIRIKNDYYYDYNVSGSPMEVLYTPVFSDTIYRLGENALDLYPAFAINFPGTKLKDIVRKNQNITIEDLNGLMNSYKYYNFMGKIFSVDKSLYYIECEKKEQLGYFYSSRKNKIIGGNIKSTIKFNDSLKFDNYRFPIASTDKEFVSMIKPIDVNNDINSLRTKKYNKAIENFNKNSNPILVFYKLKDF